MSTHRYRLLLVGVLYIVAILCGFLGISAAAQSTNTTQSIAVNIADTTSPDTLTLSYEIMQKFNTPSRGVFISLPRNQGGVWTEYTIKSVQLVNTNTQEKIPTQYNIIKEWDQFRVRFGDPESVLPIGLYKYTFTLEAHKSEEFQYNFTVLRDWLDPVTFIDVRQSGKSVCTQGQCTAKKSSIILNGDKTPVPHYISIWHRYKGIINSIIISSTIGFLSWVRLSKDKSIGDTKKPRYEPPNVYPWEAEFIRKGTISLKRTFLSYILWLANSNIISIKPSGKQMVVTIKKDLPNLLPSIFNKAVQQISQHGLAKGIKKTKFTASDEFELSEYLIEKTSKYFSQKHIKSNTFAILIFAPIFAFFLIMVITYFVFQTILIGNSYISLIILNAVILYVFYIWILITWPNMNRVGRQLKKEVKQYFYYLHYVESERLNVGNTETSLQYYLDQLPYAASFGILDNLTSYIQRHFPDLSEVQTISTTASVIATSVTYTSVTNTSSTPSFSSSSGGGFSGGGGSW